MLIEMVFPLVNDKIQIQGQVGGRRQGNNIRQGSTGGFNSIQHVLLFQKLNETGTKTVKCSDSIELASRYMELIILFSTFSLCAKYFIIKRSFVII